MQPILLSLVVSLHLSLSLSCLFLVFSCRSLLPCFPFLSLSVSLGLTPSLLHSLSVSVLSVAHPYSFFLALSLPLSLSLYLFSLLLLSPPCVFLFLSPLSISHTHALSLLSLSLLSLTLTRALSSNPYYRARVVAVIVAGPEWQFRDWPDVRAGKKPVDLFSKCKSWDAVVSGYCTLLMLACLYRPSLLSTHLSQSLWYFWTETRVEQSCRVESFEATADQKSHSTVTNLFHVQTKHFTFASTAKSRTPMLGHGTASSSRYVCRRFWCRKS